jgi:hypothetical protein
MLARTSGALSPLEPVLSSRYDPASFFESPLPSEQPEMLETIQSAPAEVSLAAEVQESGRDPLLAVYAAAYAPPADARREGRPRPEEPREFNEVRSTGKAVPMLGDARQRETRAASHSAQESPSELQSQKILTETVQSRVATKSITQDREMFRPEQIVPASGPGSAPMVKHGKPDAASSVLREAPSEVNVTIGAIEVRLAQPAKPAVRKAATPRVSLADYLSRRNGGPR